MEPDFRQAESKNSRSTMSVPLRSSPGEKQRYSRRTILIGISGAATIIMMLAIFTTPYMAVATIAYFLLASGVIFRAQRKIHVPLMTSGVVIDVALVLVLEITRSAIATAAGGTLNSWQKGHIVFSSMAVALYLPTMIFGAKSVMNPAGDKKRKIHTYLGRIAFFCRTSGFFLMFSLLEHVKK